jgi:ketosteroid isomerase-like protein
MKKGIVLLLFSVLALPLFSQEMKSSLSSKGLKSEDVRSTNLATVSSYFEFLFKRGDFVSLEKLILKDAIYSQADGLPYGGTYIGFNQWLTMFGKVQSYFELKLVSDEILYSHKDSNTVVANFSIQFKSKKTNQIIEMPVMELFELRDGKIISVKPFYFDTKKIHDFSE